MALFLAACMFTCIALVALIVFPYALCSSVTLLVAHGPSARHAAHATAIAAACGDVLFVLLFVLPIISNAGKWGFLAVLALLDFGFFLAALYLSSPVRAQARASMPAGVVWVRFIAPLVARVAPQWHAK